MDGYDDDGGNAWFSPRKLPSAAPNPWGQGLSAAPFTAKGSSPKGSSQISVVVLSVVLGCGITISGKMSNFKQVVNARVTGVQWRKERVHWGLPPPLPSQKK